MIAASSAPKNLQPIKWSTNQYTTIDDWPNQNGSRRVIAIDRRMSTHSGMRSEWTTRDRCKSMNGHPNDYDRTGVKPSGLQSSLPTP